ncbi:putative neprosin, partial [Tanacetum coccineum]
PDDYHTGCYNLLCPGFVQISSKFALGAALHPLSTYNGQQYDIIILIWKDPRTGNWWLSMGDNLMGYWPSSLFPDLFNNATEIHYGGEVINNIGRVHTSTQMGSGHFPEEGFKKAAFVRNLEVVSSENRIYPVSDLELVEEASNCYNVKSGFRNNWGNYIFFGGPGNNPNCP